VCRRLLEAIAAGTIIRIIIITTTITAGHGA
jgi:hypothetical protein